MTRRKGEEVALTTADELASLMETLHLLRSPRNAQRLLEALTEADARVTPPQTADQLRQELGLDQKE